jgi:hypothetical protein
VQGHDVNFSYAWSKQFSLSPVQSTFKDCTWIILENMGVEWIRENVIMSSAFAHMTLILFPNHSIAYPRPLWFNGSIKNWHSISILICTIKHIH